MNAVGWMNVALISLIQCCVYSCEQRLPQNHRARSNLGALLTFDYNPRPCALIEEIFCERRRA